MFFSVCSAYAKDYLAYDQHTFKKQSMRLVITYDENPNKKNKTQKFLKIFLEPLIRVPKTSHTTFFFGLS
jgi:hypothetical protein